MNIKFSTKEIVGLRRAENETKECQEHSATGRKECWVDWWNSIWRQSTGMGLSPYIHCSDIFNDDG